VRRKTKLRKPEGRSSVLGLGVFDLQNGDRGRSYLFGTQRTTKTGKRRTGFFILCRKFGFETVLNLGDFALQLLPDLTKLLNLAPAIFNFRLRSSLLNDLQRICQFGYYGITC